MTWFKRNFWLLAAATLPTLSVGCIQPWHATRVEQKLNYKNDQRTPVLPPVQDGFPPPLCEDPPTDLEVLRVLKAPVRGVPFVYEEFRDEIVVQSTRIVDKIDPPRFFPLVGWAQLHHCHWECAVYYNELIQSSYPWPVYTRRPRVQVVYIDKDHLHLYVGPNQDMQRQQLLEMSKFN